MASETPRPTARPLITRALSTAQGESAPGSFYGGVIGGSYINEVEKTYKNETGRPSHGREDALIGVNAAKEFVKDPTRVEPGRDIFHEFSLQDRVALVSGANSGIGLEMALALAEAGATVFCLDLADSGSADFQAAAKYAIKLGSRMIYLKADVTDQPRMNEIAHDIAEKEGRLDVCIAAAGILMGADCLEYPIKDFDKVMAVNVSGVFITATACAREMARLERPGSIILIGSMSGTIANREE
ncbi:hypothetical protein RQP46_001865 [Phenoliferia psychrophenolica]